MNWFAVCICRYGTPCNAPPFFLLLTVNINGFLVAVQSLQIKIMLKKYYYTQSSKIIQKFPFFLIMYK